jgi:hypothetical protein
MNVPPVDELIDRLAADAKPVRPLASPLKRALKTLALLALGGGIAVLARGDAERLLARYAGREGIMALELAAMLATECWLSPLHSLFRSLAARGVGCLRPSPHFSSGCF